MRRAQSLLEFMLVLPVILAVIVGSIAFLDAYSRFERIDVATSMAARAAATSTGDRTAVAQQTARSVLAGTFSPEDVRVSVEGEDPCAYGDPLTVITEVRWNLWSIPFYGDLHVDFKAVRKSVCEAI